MNDDIEFATSVSFPYFVKYGKELVSTFLKFVEAPSTLVVYHEASSEKRRPEDYFALTSRLYLVDVHAETALPSFLPVAEGKMAAKGCRVSSDPDDRDPCRGYDYRWNAAAFGKKAFSFVHAARSTRADYLFWIDADAVFRKPTPLELLKSLFREDVDVVYFGREWPHTETGFFGVRPWSGATLEFVKRYARFWEGREIFSVKEGWTDCHAFDLALAESRAEDGLRARNLSTIPRGHVIAASPLGEHVDHRKGLGRKHAGRSPEAKR